MSKPFLVVIVLVLLSCTACMQHNPVEEEPGRQLEQEVESLPNETVKPDESDVPDEVDKPESPEADPEPQIVFDAEMPYKVETLLENLEVPWAIDIADDGRIFFTERPGRVRLYQEGELIKEPVITLPDTYHKSEGGLLGLVLHPEFSHNNMLFVYQTYLEKGAAKNRVIRLLLEGQKATVDKIIIDGLPGANNHNGGRIKIGTDNKLYVTAGEIYQTHLAQQLNNLGGKILRLELDGSTPLDNPFDNSPVYSWGHRNPQGLAWHPETNHLFSSEHGQSAHDEINIIFPGENYGWPVIEGDKVADGMNRPLLHSDLETWAPSGSTFITEGPWQHNLLVANLRGEQIIRLVFDYANDQFNVKRQVALFKNEYGRIRDIYEATDGVIYFLTNNHDGRGTPTASDDRIMILIPEYK